MTEKRSHTRYVVFADINLKSEDGQIYNFKTGVSNISFSGVNISSQVPEELENKLVYFELVTELSQETLIGTGRIKYIIKEVRRDNPLIFKMGLEFINIDKNLLLHLVNRLQDIHSSRIKKTQRFQKRSGGYFGPY